MPLLKIGAGRALLNVVAAAGGPPTWTKTASPAIQNTGFADTFYTFTSVAVNNPATGNTIVVRLSSGYTQVTGITIGGDAMTKQVETGSTGTGVCSIWTRTGNIYTTPNIVTTGGAALSTVGIDVGYFANVTATPTDTDVLAYGYAADPQLAGSVTVPANGIALAVARSETAGNNPTWNNMTEDTDVTATGLRHTTAYLASAGAFQASVSGFSFAGCAMAVAAWGP